MEQLCRKAGRWLPTAAPGPQPPRGRNGAGVGPADCSALLLIRSLVQPA